MKKTLLPLVVGSLLLVGLTACSVEVRDASPTKPPVSSSTAPDPGASDNPISGGGFSSIDCTGKDITIDQDDTNAVLSGQCGAITISAEGVFVSAETADSVTITGSRIDVVMTGAVGTVSVGGEKNSFMGQDATSVDVPGSSVTVTLADAGSISIGGSNNFVTWLSGAASATDTGTANTVLAP